MSPKVIELPEIAASTVISIENQNLLDQGKPNPSWRNVEFIDLVTCLDTPPIAEILMCQKWEGDCGLWALNKIIFKKFTESLKKSWEQFGSCLLNSTANPAKLGSKWAELAVLFSRQLQNGSHDFFQTFSICFFNYFIKNPQTTIALPFLTHNVQL